ncbi:MAG: hydroxyacid-oxoacid transhydrogenase [Halodesulfurarchaeum sp.]
MFEADSVWRFTAADSIAFGKGAADELGDHLLERDVETALVVCDPGIADAGIVEDITAGDAVEYELFDRVEPEPPKSVFEEAVEYARDVDPDAIVGVGGGSSMDVAKTTGIVAAHGGEIMDYVAEPTGEGKPVPGPGIPTIAMPTTAGTGSETTPVSVVSLPERDMKVGISSVHQYPDLAIVDPLLTVSLPPGPTAASGIDALAHGIEAYVTRSFDAKERPDTPADRPDYGGRTILTDQLARTAIELVGNNLQSAVDNGEDVEARRNMSLGSLLAGIAFSNAGLGATHAIAMAAGAEHHTPHGETVSAVLPAVMRHNAPSRPDRFEEIATVLGVDTAGLDQREAAEAAATAVEELADDVGLPDGLSDFGLEEEDVDHLADRTMDLQRLLVGNPRRVTREDVVSMCRESL